MYPTAYIIEDTHLNLLNMRLNEPCSCLSVSQVVSQNKAAQQSGFLSGCQDEAEPGQLRYRKRPFFCLRDPVRVVKLPILVQLL